MRWAVIIVLLLVGCGKREVSTIPPTPSTMPEAPAVPQDEPFVEIENEASDTDGDGSADQ
jgi:hypothetical protein